VDVEGHDAALERFVEQPATLNRDTFSSSAMSLLVVPSR